MKRKCLNIIIAILLLCGIAQADWQFNPYTQKLDYTIYARAQATGDLLYFSGGVWTALNIGANGTFLSVAAGLPSWVAGAMIPASTIQYSTLVATAAGGWVENTVMRIFNQTIYVPGGNMHVQEYADGNVLVFSSSGPGENRYLYLYGRDGGSVKWFRMRVQSSGHSEIESAENMTIDATGSLYLNFEASGNASFFENSASAETRELRIFGFRAADALRSLQIGVGVDANDQASFDGVSTYYFDGALSLLTDLAVLHGGTGVSTLTDHGVLLGSGIGAITASAVGTAGQVFQSLGAGLDPVWSTATYPSTTTINQILYSIANNSVTGLATANSGLLVTSAGGVPSIAIDIPTAVTIGGQYVYRVAGTDVSVADGGTGRSTSTIAYGLLAAGTLATNPHQTLAAGLTTQILVGGGAAALPAWGIDIPTGVTIGAAYVYRVGGTDVAVADGGTGVGVWVTGDIVYASGVGTLAGLADVAVNQVLVSGGVGVAPAYSATPTVTSITATNANLTGELDMTGTVTIDMNPSSAATQTLVDIVPSAAIGAGAIWTGMGIDGAALDPSAANAEIYALYADFSDVDLTNEPDIEAVRISMPANYSGQSDLCAFEATGNGMTVEIIDNDKGQNAIYVDGGEASINYATGNAVAAAYQAMNIQVDVDDLDANSLFHFVNYTATGTTTGEVAAVGVYAGILPIHQHAGVFATPNQVNYAARWPNAGAWTAGIDGNQIFVADDDEIFIGDVAVFDELEVILTVVSSKDVKPEFYYYNTGLAWVQFYPTDNTDGFEQDGLITWSSGDFTNWKSDYNPGGGGAGYFIKVKRTRNSVATPPTPTTIKFLAATIYQWDASGDLTVNTGIFQGGSVTLGTASQVGSLEIYDGSDHKITFTSPGIAADYTLTWPTTDGDAADKYLKTTDANGTLTFATITGFIADPGASTDHAVLRWDGATGDAVQDTTIIVSDNGEMTNASQPCVIAYNSATDADITGDGTWVTVDIDTEITDQGGDFAADTFTAPVDGSYIVNANVRFDDLDSDTYEAMQGRIVTSNRTWEIGLLNPEGVRSAGTADLFIVAIVDMDAADTLTLGAVVYTGTKTVDIIGAGAPITFLTIALLN